MGDREPLKARRGRVEDHCCIDAGVLRNTGKLALGASAVWSWSKGTGIIGTVHLVAKANSIDICGYVATGTGVELVQDVLQIIRVPARFADRPCGRGRGAVSTFLLCPGCQSRRRKLYFVGSECRCRDCHRLGFAVTGCGFGCERMPRRGLARDFPGTTGASTPVVHLRPP
jgi:hypothetical protein